MIYVIQQDNYEKDVFYAGSSAHEALLIASQLPSCRVRIFKNGKRFKVTQAKESETNV